MLQYQVKGVMPGQQQINNGLQCMDNLLLWIIELIGFNSLTELVSLRHEIGALLGVGASLWQLPSFSTLRLTC